MLLLEHLFHLILNVARIEKHFRNKTQRTTVLSFMVDLSSIALGAFDPLRHLLLKGAIGTRPNGDAGVNNTPNNPATANQINIANNVTNTPPVLRDNNLSVRSILNCQGH